MESFRDLGQRVKTHLCYAHVFQDALTRDELVARCHPDAPGLVDAELARLEAEGSVQRIGEYCVLAGRDISQIAAAKRALRDEARELLAQRRTILALLCRLPFVRMLAISGSLARDHPIARMDNRVDLDLFVITAPSTLHVLRFLFRVVDIVSRLLAALGVTKQPVSLCPNYVTESCFAEITNKSFYTASDALCVKVLKGPDEYRRFLAANPWIARYFPVHTDGPTFTHEPLAAHALYRIFNVVCFTALGSASWIKTRLSGKPFQYSISFRFDRTVSFRRYAVPGGGYQPQVAGRFAETYRRYFGLDEALNEFLFPGTTRTGVYHGRMHASSRARPLVYDE